MEDTEDQAPPSITFSLIKESLRYHQDFYSPDLTDNRASPDRVDLCLSKIEFELQSSYPKQKGLQCCLPFVYLVMFLLIVGIRKVFDYIFGQITLIEMGIIMILYGILIFLCSHFANLYMYNQIKAKCQLIVDEQNEILKQRGLRWDLPKEFPELIELYKDYKSPTYEHNKLSKRAPLKRKYSSKPTAASSPLSRSVSVNLSVIPEFQPQKSARKKSQKKKYVPFPEENNA